METVESNRRNPKKWLRRNKKILISVAGFAVGMGCLAYFGLYQKKGNLDLMQSTTSELAPDSAHASNITGGFPAVGLGKSSAGDTQAYYLNIGMRQECQGTYYKGFFPDIDYAFMGYNVLRGYPLATGHDPGFTYPIFSADYRKGKHTADCRYSVPDGLVVVPDVSCVTSFSSKIVQTKYELANALSVSASVSGGGWGASFSASAGYKEYSSEMSTGESVYIFSSAKCHYYFCKLVKGSPPPFDPVFLNWVEKLNNTNLNDTYLEFFDTYGTHFATEVTFGARFTYEHKMSSEKYESQRKFRVNVAAQASYSGLLSVGGGFSMDNLQRESASEFSKYVDTKAITVGAAPPANGDAMTWASTVKTSPVPSEYKLSSIEELFTEKYMNPTKLNANLTLISQNIKAYKKEYCKYLMLKGEVDSCESLSPTRMVLENTRLYNHYELVSSYQGCIDLCLNQINCSAITYCDFCFTWDIYFLNKHKCFLFNTEHEIAAQNEDQWKTIVFLNKMKAKLVLRDTTVDGTERGFEREEDKNADAIKCEKLCVKDAHCILYSYCQCPDVEQKCKLYSFENFRGFKEETGTKSVFIDKN